MRDARVPVTSHNSLRTCALPISQRSEKVLAPQPDNQQNDAAAPSQFGRLFTLVDSKASTPASMSQTESPNTELDRLRTAVQDYEKKLSEAAELVAHVRHEINNPLAALLGQAQLLLREELSEKSRRRAETIESQAKRIQQIVGELRAVQAPPSAVNNPG